MGHGPYTRLRVAAFAGSTAKGQGYADLKKNLERVNGALNAVTIKLKQLKDGDEVLRVFLMPEWTWKLNVGFYGHKDVNEIITTLRKVSLEQHPLLIFGGSILWSLPAGLDDNEAKTAYDWNGWKLGVGLAAGKA